MKRNFFMLLVLVALTIMTAVIFFAKQGRWFSTTGNVGEVLNDFAIKDTSKVVRIYISDTEGRKVNLTRTENSRFWLVNGQHKVREDAIKLLLKTFKRIKVKAPVTVTAQKNVIGMLAGSGTRVEIFGEDELLKTYLIGTCTPDHVGTYMVLEHSDGQRSSEPLIMRMEGFTGCLRQRFFTNEEDWRYTGIFNYSNLEIKKVEVLNNEHPESSFSILYGGGNDIKLFSEYLEREIPQFDTLAVKNYLVKYKKIHFETFDSHLSKSGEDSLLKTQPAFTIRVIDNQNKNKKVELYWKKPITPQMNEHGVLRKWDGDRMYGCTDGSDVVLVQLYTFQSLIEGVEQFRPR